MPDDVFKSTVHRAVNRSGIHRYSIPLFFGTDYDVKLEVFSMVTTRCSTYQCFIQPIPSCVSDDRPQKYEVVAAGDYVKEKLKATYGH